MIMIIMIGRVGKIGVRAHSLVVGGLGPEQERVRAAVSCSLNLVQAGLFITFLKLGTFMQALSRSMYVHCKGEGSHLETSTCANDPCPGQNSQLDACAMLYTSE